jgi:GNAT superfamily N-acetyltransferase
MEIRAMRAWPSQHCEAFGQWSLHCSAGFSGRLNACWPNGDPDRALDQAIDHVEAWYRLRSRPVIFKPAGPEGELEAALSGRGYARRTPTMVMIADLSNPRLDLDPSDVTLSVDVRPEFAQAFAAAQTDLEDARERLEALARVPLPRSMGVLGDGDQAEAIGAMAVEGDWCGLFAMRTLPQARRRGLARKMVSALLWQARQHGSKFAWLQVEVENRAAISLYSGLGFEEAYRYHYWER